MRTMAQSHSIQRLLVRLQVVAQSQLGTGFRRSAGTQPVCKHSVEDGESRLGSLSAVFNFHPYIRDSNKYGKGNSYLFKSGVTFFS